MKDYQIEINTTSGEVFYRVVWAEDKTDAIQKAAKNLHWILPPGEVASFIQAS